MTPNQDRIVGWFKSDQVDESGKIFGIIVRMNARPHASVTAADDHVLLQGPFTEFDRINPGNLKSQDPTLVFR